MRISDWSSDVCSSDLEVPERTDDDGLDGDAHEQAHDEDAHGGEQHGRPAVGPGQRVGAVEIGRASCRERVCQYVSISVVAVSLKKKYAQESVQTSQH